MKGLAALKLIVAVVAAWAMSQGTAGASAATADPAKGELAAAIPREPPGGRPETGLVTLPSHGFRPALLYVPASVGPMQRPPLLVMLHGAGEGPEDAIELVRDQADRLGMIVLAPASSGRSWDIISSRRYGRDVRSIDDALSRLLATYPLDSSRIVIGGFSDGASYALSLGLANGQLFTDIVAFSPGFVAPAQHRGKPRIFVSHGVRDRVLPIGSTSRRFVPMLRKSGFEVNYHEFSQGHVVPQQVLREAFRPLVR